MVSMTIKRTLRSQDDHFVFSMTQWEEVAIDEEGEKGEKVKSSIHVPSNVSCYFLVVIVIFC